MIGSGRPKTGRPKDGSYRQGRNKKLCIRLSDGDLRKLEEVCNYYYISKSDFLIDAITSAFKEVKRGEKERK